jgi:hypothetical protein
MLASGTRIAKHPEAPLAHGVDSFVRTVEGVAGIGSAKVFREDGQEGITIHVGFLQQNH